MRAGWAVSTTAERPSVSQSPHHSLRPPTRTCQTTSHAIQTTAVLRLISAHYTHTHTHTPIKGPFSRTTRVSRYQKGKTNLDFTEARDCAWQWHQLGHMQVCISLQTTTPAPDHSFFTGRMPFLPPNK